MFLRFWAVASNTFLETIRQPIFSVILIVTTILMMLNVSLAAFTLEDDNKLLLDLGLSTLLLSGLFLAAFSAAGILSREIENKTVLTVISKPIGRPLFIVGKFVGLAGALITAFYISSLVFFLSVRHGVLQNSSDPWDAPVLVFGGAAIILSYAISAFRNYFYGKHFLTGVTMFQVILLTVAIIMVPRFDKKWNVVPYGSDFIGGQVIIAAYLVLLIVLVMAAIALAVSTRFGQLMTLVICTCVLGVGIMADYIFGQYADRSTLASVAYRVFPNVGPFWIIDGLTAKSPDTTATFEYVKYVTAYGLLFTVGMVSLAVASFQRREVG